MNHYFDIYTVGVGGQGILTISEIITQTAAQKGVEVNFFPTKGMAQRGGFVKSQVRLGRLPGTYSPSLSPESADLIVSMELSETLKAIRYGKKGADYVVLGLRWNPAAVMLGKAPYPEVDDVLGAIRDAGGNVHYLDPSDMPEGARGNLYTLGAVCANSRLSELMTLEEIEDVVAKKWPKVAESNIAILKAGYHALDKK